MRASRKRTLLAITAGALTTLALPPFYIIPVLAISFPALLLLLERCETKRKAFWLGWWFGFAHHVTGLYWICNSLLVDAEHFAWLIPFAISFIPAYLALYTGLVTMLTWRSKQQGWRRVVLFACLWTLAEIARAYLLTGFPWNSIGYVWAKTIPDNLVAFFGVYGMTLYTVLAASMLVVLRKKRGWIPNVAVLMLCGVTFITTGLLKLEMGLQVAEDKTPPFFKVRVVQPNIKQSMKWDREYAMDSLMKHIELTRAPYEGVPPKVVVWPESAIPFRLEDDESLRRVIADSLPPGAVVFVGGVRIADEKIYNSLMVMNDDGEILATYDKHHLVPFGEYVPLRFLFPFIEKITEGGMDFSSGEGAQTLRIDGIPPFSPLICYEGIFSGQVKDGNDLPAWMVNITNDAWFGTSTGPYQHLAMVKMRAAEENIALVRAANTGISAVINSSGRITEQQELNNAGVIDAYVEYLTEPRHRTFYSRHGLFTPLVCILFLLSMVYLRKR